MNKDRKPLWIRRGVLFLAVLLVLMLFGFGVTQSGWGVQTAQAAPPRQNDDPYKLCELIKDYVSTFQRREGTLCLGTVRNYGTEVPAPLTIMEFLEPDIQSARKWVGEGAEASPTLKYGSFKVGEFSTEIWDTSYNAFNPAIIDSVNYSFEFSEGCYAIVIDGPSVPFMGSATGIETDVHNWAKQIDATIVARGNPCPQNPVAAQPAQPVNTKFEVTSMVCVSTAQETGKAGRVICNIATANEPPDATVSFAWTIDGVFAGLQRNLNVDGVSQGRHKVSVTATLGGQQSTFSSWVTVAESGTSTFSLSVGCSYDQGSNSVKCHATPVNPPAMCNLEYSWSWDGGSNDSKTADITVEAPAGGHTYEVKVQALDRNSSTNSQVASTSVTVTNSVSASTSGTTGNSPAPSTLGQDVNIALTGVANPIGMLNPATAAGGAATVGLALGLVTLSTLLLNSTPQLAANGAANQIRPALQGGEDEPGGAPAPAGLIGWDNAAQQTPQGGEDKPGGSPAQEAEENAQPPAHPQESGATPDNLGAAVIWGVGNNIDSANADYRDRYIKLRDEIKNLEAQWKENNDRARAANAEVNILQDDVVNMVEEQNACKMQGQPYAREDDLEIAKTRLHEAKLECAQYRNLANAWQINLDHARERMKQLRHGDNPA